MHRRHHHHKPKVKVLMEGKLFVTGEGEVIIEEALRVSRALLTHSHEAVVVDFVGEPDCHPCVPLVPDELDWKLFERMHHGFKEIFLKIFWRVSSSRVIAWRVFEIK